MRHTSSHLARLLLITSCFGAGCNAHAADVTIPNFEKVTPSLWRGAAPTDENIKQLASLGVHTIVDLRMLKHDSEEQKATELGINYVRIPLGYWAPSRKTVSKFFDLVKNTKDGPVFVHCRQGADRTGMLIGLYRRKFFHWPFEKTYSEMRAHHFKPFLLPMRELVEDYPDTAPTEQEASTTTFAAVDKHAGATVLPK